MSSHQPPPGPIDYDALDDYLILHNPGVKELSKGKNTFLQVLGAMVLSGHGCMCWGQRKPGSIGDEATYLELYLEIGDGDGQSIKSLMQNEQGSRRILEKMTKAVIACRCNAALVRFSQPQSNPMPASKPAVHAKSAVDAEKFYKDWEFERTEIFHPNANNEDPNSKTLWKPKAFPKNYKDLTGQDWKYDESAPTLRATPIPDKWCWKNIFGQDSSIKPGMAPLHVLQQSFKIDKDPSKIPIVVALDVEQSVTTFQWHGDHDMISKIPTQVGISYFDPLDAMAPSKDIKKKYRNMFQRDLAPGQSIAPGDRGFIWRGSGLFTTQLYYAQVEAQYYATEGMIPKWARSKGLYPDGGSFTFHEAKGLKMKSMRPEVVGYLASLQHRKTNKGEIRELCFVTWNYRMEMGAFRFLGLWDYLPGGKYHQQKKIQWWDLQQHWAIKNKTAILQNPNETRKLENFIAHDLKIYTEEDMKRWAHNAGMDAASTLEGFIGIFTIPEACFGPRDTRPEGGMHGWATFGTQYQLSRQNRKLNDEEALKNIKSYDALWKKSKNMFTYTTPVPIQQRMG